MGLESESEIFEMDLNFKYREDLRIFLMPVVGWIGIIYHDKSVTAMNILRNFRIIRCICMNKSFTAFFTGDSQNFH